jgi:nucleoside phosphorylase
VSATVSAHIDLLVLAAFHPEIAPLRPHLGDAMRGRVGTAVIAARTVGIGLPMAAVGTAMHLGELQPRAALLIGTCGAYDGCGLSIGEVVVARRVRLVDPSELGGLTQFPEPMAVVTDAHAPMADRIAAATGARSADVATTLAITVDDATAGRIARATGVEVEHLESHGVATACAARGVPFGAVLGIANFVGSRARAEWRMHHREAASRAADAVVRWLSGGGLPDLGSLPE